jgi:TRAP-type mannitol/chloroaromatic compound transport system permease small subunit
MKSLLALSRLIDTVNRCLGRSVTWLILIVVVISASNAVIRKLFNTCVWT